jgi:hypothetical protein
VLQLELTRGTVEIARSLGLRERKMSDYTLKYIHCWNITLIVPIPARVSPVRWGTLQTPR